MKAPRVILKTPATPKAPAMARITIHIPHVKWRDGRPRFDASPALRKLGFKGEDLRHGPKGEWLTLAEVQAWLPTRMTEIARRKAGGKRQHAPRTVGPLTLGHLIERMFKEDEQMRLGPAMVGKRRIRKLADNTLKGYRDKADQLMSFDDEVWARPVDSITRKYASSLATALHEAYGLASMRAIMRLISRAISWGKNNGLNHKEREHPCFALKLETPAPRQRFGTLNELKTLIDTADSLGLPEVGDMIHLGVFTAQRQADRMLMEDRGVTGERRVIRQQKTNAVVSLPINRLPWFERRMSAIRQRKQLSNIKVIANTIVTDSKTGKPLTKHTYRKLFVVVREAAVKTCPTLASFTDQDLRDTAVMILALSECTIPEISSITGHSLEQATQILAHYLGFHPELADNATDKMAIWMAKQKVQL